MIPERPLLSIITPTWQRHALLSELIDHVREQTYPNVEHVIVSDGPDEALEDMTVNDVTWWYGNHLPGHAYNVRWHSCGRNYSGLWPESFGIAPLTYGMLAARGEYQVWWSDDDRALVPSHLSQLVDLLERTGADFVYPKVRIWRNGNPDGPESGVIGSDPPRHGQITHFIYRASLMHKGMPRWGHHPCDIDLVNQWMVRGARWKMLDAVTFSHRLDR